MDSDETNSAFGLIKKAFNNDASLLNLNDVNFKSNCMTKKIQKLLKLKSLKINESEIDEIKYFPPNLEEINISNCTLIHFDTSSAPKSLIKISLENNLLEFFADGNIFLNLVELNLSYNKLTNIPLIPPNLKKLNIERNELEKIENLLESQLEYLNISGNDIQTLEGLPPTLKKLEIDKNSITILDISNLFKLEYLNANSNDIVTINNNFPETLIHIELNHNQLESIPDINSNIVTLELSNNRLKFLPKIKTIDYIKNFDFSFNENIKITNEEKVELEKIKLNTNNNPEDDSLDDSFHESNIESSEESSEESQLSISSNKKVKLIITNNNKLPEKISIKLKRCYDL
jgi:Leucine-rich repeat (LRR) protein